MPSRKATVPVVAAPAPALTVADNVTEDPVVTLDLDKASDVVVAEGAELVLPPLVFPPPDPQPDNVKRATDKMPGKRSEFQPRIKLSSF